MQNETLKAIFEKFANREVDTHIDPPTPASRGRAVAKLNPQDEAVSELRQAVEAAGFSLRVWMPNSIGTMDYRTNRVNVHIAPDMQGVYRMGNFRIG